jgi:lipopolysaccharide transport system ATP-binding protein
MSKSDIAVSVRGLSKAYTIAHNDERQVTLAEQMLHRLRNPFKRAQTETFWALKDVEFDIKKGDVVGIIGRNGAGKSTLLKILSRITEPTAGEIRLYGRVGSLLEVGTGFHPELTGRENIYLNGQILGMRRKEIDKQFDAIVAFAEIEKFLDTPVKRYSSGMYVRLAFSVAAHLNPEILIVDEVLAVGDSAFQKRCLGKMQEVSRDEGRTVIFVSHNMGAITRLCNRAITLERGRLKFQGWPDEAVNAYLMESGGSEGEHRWDIPGIDIPGMKGGKIHLVAVRVINEQGLPTSSVNVTQVFSVEVEYDILQPLARSRVSLFLMAEDGTIVFTAADCTGNDWFERVRQPGRYISRCQIPGNLLNTTQYAVRVAADTPGIAVHFDVEPAITFAVEPTGGVTERFASFERWPGVTCPLLNWEIERLSSITDGAAGVASAR